MREQLERHRKCTTRHTLHQHIAQLVTATVGSNETLTSEMSDEAAAEGGNTLGHMLGASANVEHMQEYVTLYTVDSGSDQASAQECDVSRKICLYVMQA